MHKELVESLNKVQLHVLFPTPSTLKPLQKGDSNGECVEKEIPYGPLKYTCQRYNLNIVTGEGKEIYELNFYEPEPLN